MRHPSSLVIRYRIVLERAEDQTLVARCVELPGPCARELNVDAAVDSLRDTLAVEVADLRSRGEAPTPLQESEGRLAAWMRDLELLPEPRPKALVTVEKPLPSTMHAIAQWTTDRYRIVLEEDEVEGFVATSPEMPELAGYGLKASSAVADLRARMEEQAFKILNDNRVPPEPLQEIEAREERKARTHRPSMAIAA
jgi:predicted RNase H-like HicB family nuclease